MPNKNITPSWDETVEIKTSVPSFDETIPVKKKEEPVSFGVSESSALPSASTETEPTEDLLNSKQIGDVLKKVPLSFVFPHADEKFLAKTRNPLDVFGKEEDVASVKQTLPEEDNIAISSTINPKGDPSYFWGTVKAINTGTASFFRAVDNAVKTVSDVTGLDRGGMFGKIADTVQETADKMPDVPNTRAGRLLRNVGQLEGLFLELAITPEFKIAKIGKVPKLITQMTGAGFVNSYADAIEKEPDIASRAVEGLKGAGVGAKDAAILVGLGYGSALAGGVVGKVVGSEIVGGITSTLTNAVGFAGSDVVQQLISNGDKPIDWNSVEQNFDIGLALGIPEIAKRIGTRAMTNYFTSSPNAEKESLSTGKTPEQLRQDAINIREASKTKPTEERAADEAQANVIDGIADIKVISKEVAAEPEKFKQSIKEDETLTPEEKKVYEQKIDNTVELATKKQEPVVVAETKPIEFKPKEDVSEAVEPRSTEEAPIVPPEQKDVLKQQKEVVVEPTQEHVVGLKEKTIKSGLSGLAKQVDLAKDEDQFLRDIITDTDVRYKNRKAAQPLVTEQSIESIDAIKPSQKTEKETVDFWKEKIEKGEKPFVIIRENNTIDGQHKLQAYRELGIDQIPALKETDLKEFYQQQKKQPVLVEPTIEVKQQTQVTDEKETDVNAKAQRGQGRKEKLLEKSKQADVLLSEGLSDIADLLGTKLSLTGEQRVKVKDAVRKVAKGLVLKGEVKIEELAIAVKEYFSKAGHDISDELINEALKEEQDAKGIREQDKGDLGTQERVVEGKEGKIPMGDDGKDQKTPRSDGEKVRQQGKKIIESSNLPQDLRDEFEAKGITYLPRGRKVTKAEATEIAKTKLQMEGGREALKSEILNPANDIVGDTRIAMAVEFVRDARSKMMESNDPVETAKRRQDITDVLTYTMNRSTLAGQELEANKMISELLGSDPEFIEDVYRNDVRKKNEPFLQANKENIKSAQDIITEYLNSEEFQKKYKVKPPTQEGKLTTKELRERGINKIANATSKIADIIGAKKNFTSEEMSKGTDIFDALKELGDGLLDVGVASTKELLDKIKSNMRKYFKPSEIDAISNDLLAELKAEERIKPKQPRVVSLDAKDEKVLVDRLYSKVLNANEKQLKQLLADNVDLLIREGSINDEAFKELFAKAMGKEFVDQKQIDKLKASAQLVQDLKKVKEDLEKLYDHAIDAQNQGVPKGEIDAIKKEIGKKLKEYFKATHEAEKATKDIGEVFVGKGVLAEKISAIIKGNLITPASQVVNIIGNYSMVPVRTPKNAMSTLIDIMISESAGRLTDKLKANLNKKEIKYIKNEAERLGIPESEVTVPISFSKQRRVLDKLPDRGFNITGYGLSKERFVGEAMGFKQGVKQLWTGALPTDLQRVEVRAGLHPLDALYDNYRMLSGKEKLEFKKFFENTYEGTVGVAPEITFRFLNLFDKAPRMGAERDMLNQIANEKGLKGLEKEKFLELPDLESAERARLAGDEATFQQDTKISKLSSSADRYLIKKAQEHLDLASKAAFYSLYFAKSMVVPFVKTPLNVGIELAHYAIPELSIAKAASAMYHGNRVEFRENMAKAAVGSFMIRGIGYLFGAGILTLGQGGHEDTEDKFVANKIKTAEYRDKAAYSVNWDLWSRVINNYMYGTNLPTEWQEGDEYSSYQRFGLVSLMAMSQAEAYRGKTKEEIKNMSFWQTSHGSFFPVLKSLSKQSFLSGTSTLFNLFIGDERERDNFFLGMSKAAGASVLPNGLKAYQQANDNYIRETRDARLDGFEANIYRVKTDFKASLTTGSDIPTKITIWGERVNRFEDGSTPAFQLFDITKTKKYKSDFGTKIFEFYEKMAESTDEKLKKEIPPKSILPPQLDATIRCKGEDIKLDPKTYEDMQIVVGTQLKEKVWSSLSSMDWDSASDESKYNRLKRLYGAGNSYRSKYIDRYIRSNKAKMDELWLQQYGAK